MYVKAVFNPDLRSVKAVRAFVRSALAPHAKVQGALDSAVLLASEVATNVVRHAGTPYTVAMTLEGDFARLEVWDGSSIAPAVRDIVEPDDETGRGLSIVAASALEWGVNTQGSSKVVWFVVDMTRD